MEWVSPYIWLFAAGVIAQSLFLIRHAFSWKKYILCWVVFILIVALRALTRDTDITWENGAMLFVLAYVVFFHKELLREITEAGLLVLTMVFAYVLAIHYDIFGSSVRAMHFLLVGFPIWIPIVVTLAVALINRPTPRWLQFLLYVWFIAMSISLLVMRIAWPEVYQFFDLTQPLAVTPGLLAAAFFSGGALMVLGIQIGFLFLLLPDKRTGFKASREHAGDMISRFSDAQLRTGHALMIIVLGAAILGANYIFQIVPENVMADIAVMSVGFIKHSHSV